MAGTEAEAQVWDDPAARALLDALRDAGVDTAAFGQFGRLAPRTFDFERAAPIIVAWLPRIVGPRLKEAMVRSLAGQRRRHRLGGEALLREFVRSEYVEEEPLRWAIGNSVAVVAEPTHAEPIIELLLDRRWGRSRQMLCDGLVRTGDRRGTDVLISLLTDDDVAAHAIAALRRTRLGKQRLLTPEGRARLEAILDRPSASPIAQKFARAALRLT